MTIGRYRYHLLVWISMPLIGWLPALIAWRVWDQAGWQSIAALVGAHLAACVVLAAVTSTFAAAMNTRAAQAGHDLGSEEGNER